MLVIIKSERQCWNYGEGVELTFLSMQVREDVATNTNLIKEKSTW
jgi:hypothetical protein